MIWVYLLFLPSLGGPDYSSVASAVLSFIFPGTTIFTRAPHADPLVNATVMSLLVNTAFFVIGSVTRNARPLERIQAGIFVKRQSRSQFATRGWKSRDQRRRSEGDDLALSRRRARWSGRSRPTSRTPAANWRTTSRPTWR